ncbi:hypothetical protein TNCV_815231 [Trichonephila clavipes]|nr:hypothetical protein TNCV_815231 [Trichonephila clavipes]
MPAQHGDSYLSRSKIYKWIECFKHRRTSLCNDEGSGSPSTSTTKDNEQFVDVIVMGGMASIQRRHHIFRKQKANHCLPFLLGTDRQWSYHVKRSATPRRIRRKTSDMLYRSVADYLSSSAGY